MQGCKHVRILLNTSALYRSQHLSHRFMVFLVLCHTREHFDGGFQCPHREDVCYRIATLVSRTEDRIGGARGAFSVTGYIVSNMEHVMY